MKGDASFSNEPIRTVFKTVGSLLCWRLEIEWLNQSRYAGRIENTILEKLDNFPDRGPKLVKTWRSWRTYSDPRSVFGSGQIDVVEKVIDESAKLRLLEGVLAASCKKFFKLLSGIGKGEFSLESDELDNGLNEAYGTIFKLAQIEPLPGHEFIDEVTGLTIQQSSFPPHKQVPKSDIRSFLIGAGFASLTAMEGLELALRAAQSVLDGRKMDIEVEPEIVRNLLIAKYKRESEDLVLLIHESLKLTYKTTGIPSAVTGKAVSELVASMRKKVRELIREEKESVLLNL